MKDLVLVTGGAGYIGAHTVKILLDRGYRVRVLDSFLYGKDGLAPLVSSPDLEVIEGDICDRKTVVSAVRSAKAVIALAALVGDAACDLDHGRTMRVNYESTASLLSACQDAGVRRLVFASSCSVYGANGNARLDEGSHVNPVSLYALTRVMSENLLLGAGSDVEVVILRLATVCGVSPRMRFDLMVNTMTACAHVKKTVLVSGADLWRPHIHVRDAAEAFVLAAETPGIGGRVLNAGSDEQNFTVGEVARKVAAHVPGAQIDEIPVNGDRRSYSVSFQRIRRELGFQAHYTVEDAIHEVRDLLTSGRIRDFTDKRFHNARYLSASH